MKNILISFVVLLLQVSTILANNIEVSNCGLVGQDLSAGPNNVANFTNVQFNLTWENSWRTSGAPNNWDAAWVFVKYRVQPSQVWEHAYLNPTGHNTGAGTGASIQVGLVNEGLAHDNSTNPAVGAFIYRSADGSGNFNATDLQLRWNYGAQGVGDNDIIDIMVYAVEMVYVPQGEFFLGDEGTGNGRIIEGGTSNSPFLMNSEAAVNFGNSAGQIWGTGGTYATSSSTTTNNAYNNSMGGTGTLPADFPKGFGGFYCMKYETSQQQYVDFLNALNATQQGNRAYTGGAARNGISLAGTDYITSNPFLANNYMSWADGICYADWAGLRPMTEFEFEKAARGPATPSPGEFAWSTNNIFATTGLTNAGANNEVPANANANANFTGSSVGGPIRVGAYAQTGTNREEAGASYYGIMELSGNLWERCVTIGRPQGRSFTGLHGDGFITATGDADVANWPGVNGSGAGNRGGSYVNATLNLTISDRSEGRNTDTARRNRYGFRGVRTVPSSPVN